MAERPVRVRIAPSPTGDPHVGTAYVALFNYAFAKRHNGKFLLRIEDTDQARAKSSSEGQIQKTLHWLGLNWDEGPDCGGDHGPYRQSERLPIYLKHAEMLINSGHAYRCFCTQERLGDLRIQQRQQGLPPGYDRFCRSLSEDERKQKQKEGVPFVVRLAVPTDGVTSFHDELRGKVEFENHRIDDQVLLKSDGFPTYHLANVVDDYLMKISHVIRAEEWVSSTPKHVLLYKFFGWEEPKWVHLPLLRNADRSKISKRKNPVSLEYYRRAGILPEAMTNFLALMGWSFGNDVEIFSLKQMCEKIDFKDISLGGPVFDLVKLTWLNQQYLQKLSEDEFVRHVREEVFSEAYIRAIKPLAIERIAKFDQFVDQNAFFFNGELNYKGVELSSPDPTKGKSKAEVKEMFKELVEILDECYVWQLEDLKNIMETHRAKIGWKPKDYFMPVRLAVTGRKDSPPLTETMVVLGREMVRFRLRDCMKSEAVN